VDTAEWSPQKEDVVRVKQGFDRSFEALAVRRAGLPLKEGARRMKWLGMSIAHPALFSFYAKCARSNCMAYAMWLDAVDCIQKYGAVIKSPGGCPVQSPYVSIARALPITRTVSKLRVLPGAQRTVICPSFP